MEKVVVNCALGKLTPSQSDEAMGIFTQIVGRRPYRCLARKSIAKFSIRKGVNLGFKVTLRGVAAEAFLRKLVWYILPAMSGFTGLESSCINGRTLNFGITDVNRFMIKDTGRLIRGFNVNLVARNAEILRSLVQEKMLPFKS